MFEDDYQEEEGISSVSKYEELKKSKSPIFFDIDEFGSIIDFYLRNNQFNSAFEATSLAADLYPDSIEIQIKKTQVLISKGNNDEALVLLNELKKKDPGNFEIHLTQGIACLNRKEPVKAHSCMKKALALANTVEDRIDIYITFAQEFIVNSYNDDAFDCFEMAANLSDSIDVYYDFAEFCLGNEKYEEATEVLEQMLEKDPFHVNGWLNLAGAYIYTKRDREAIKALEYALALRPDDAFAHYLMGLSHFNRDEFEKALDSLKTSLATDPDSTQALKLMIDIVWQTGDPADSKEYLERYIRLMPNDAEAHFMFSGLLNNEPEKRKQFVFKAAELDPENVIYITALASECAMEKDYTSAKEYALRAVSVDSTFEKAWIVLSVCAYYTSGPRDAWREIINGLRNSRGMGSSLCMMLSFYNFVMKRFRSGWRYYFRAVSFDSHGDEMPFVLTDFFDIREYRKFIHNKKFN